MKGYLTESPQQEVAIKLISRRTVIRDKVRWGGYNLMNLDQAVGKIAEWIHGDDT